MAKIGFKVDDVAIELDSQKIINKQIFVKKMNSLKPGEHTVKVWRNQGAKTLSFTK